MTLATTSSNNEPRDRLEGPGALARLKPSLLNWQSFAAVLLVAASWQLASNYSSPMFFPSLAKIWSSGITTFADPTSLVAIATTCLRIVASLAFSFVVALALGVAAAKYPSFEKFVVPLIELKQGIPAVCWIIFAIIWFRNMEVRIAFVIVTSALPVFFYQTRDAVRAIPSDLLDMVRALRPSYANLLRIIVLPAMLPALITSWRINIGNGTRVTIMAELLGGITGVGHQLRLAEEMFRMDQVIVWSIVLAAFVMLSNLALATIERRALRWRFSEVNDRG